MIKLFFQLAAAGFDLLLLNTRAIVIMFALLVGVSVLVIAWSEWVGYRTETTGRHRL